MASRTASRVASLSCQWSIRSFSALSVSSSSTATALIRLISSGCKVRLFQKVEYRQRFLIEPFPDSAALFLTHLVDESQQRLERLLDGHPVLLAVVFGHDLLVVPLKIRAQRVLLQQPLKSLFDGRS